MLTNVWYFPIFMLVTIFGTLIMYRYTYSENIWVGIPPSAIGSWNLWAEIPPTIILSTIWLIFWKTSCSKGRIFLVVASVIGYIHEVLGVQHGYFTYLGGVYFGVPIWLLPGYGTIFWSAHNLWKGFEGAFSKKRWFHRMNYLAVLSMVTLFIVDYSIFSLSHDIVAILFKFFIVFMLFKGLAQLRLAYFVAFFTVLTEFTGETLGTWSHPDFSFFSLMAGYVFLLWVCLTLNDYIKGVKKWGRLEALAAVVMTTFYILSLLGFFEV
ncbi:hypothetical protein V7O66_08085 [Methanolobus sp. ZRKC3]|uniref:hypothetical protein n=1 Tax=Methanolobus sp. ZRKC3 TaxID=3125786 RepID=UPI0032482CA5